MGISQDPYTSEGTAWREEDSAEAAFRKRALRLLLAVGGGGAFIIAVGATTFFARLPKVDVVRNHYPVVEHVKAKSFKIRFVRARPAGWVSVSSVPKEVKGAILVSEDWAFYQHPGYDWNQMLEAISDAWSRKRFRGASTITQQVAKNLFLSPEKTLGRKLRELVLAVRLEKTIKKDQILEIYLNIAEWGPGVFGIGKASRYYFGKEPSALNAKEAAFLAMLLPNPRKYSASFHERGLTPFAKRRMRSILNDMVMAHYLTPDDREYLKTVSLPFEDDPDVSEDESVAAGDISDSPEFDPEEEDDGSGKDFYTQEMEAPAVVPEGVVESAPGPTPETAVAEQPEAGAEGASGVTGAGENESIVEDTNPDETDDAVEEHGEPALGEQRDDDDSVHLTPSEGMSGVIDTMALPVPTAAVGF